MKGINVKKNIFVGIALQRNIYEKLGDDNTLSFLEETPKRFNQIHPIINRYHYAINNKPA